MPLGCLNAAFVVNRTAYCLSAWGGLTTSDQVSRINAVLKRDNGVVSLVTVIFSKASLNVATAKC